MARLLARLATAQRTGEVAAPAMVPPVYLDRLARRSSRVDAPPHPRRPSSLGLPDWWSR
jgi:hypothetical protein